MTRIRIGQYAPDRCPAKIAGPERPDRCSDPAMAIGFLPVLGFCVAATVTPGPNNLMVAASAANHGVRATVPHMAGIALGFAAMFLIVGLGLATPLAEHPELYRVLRWVSAAWLLWLAWQIGNAGAPTKERVGKKRPLGFFSAAAFQWVNPKAWLLAVGGTATYVALDAAVLPQVALIAGIFALVCVPSCLIWAGIGRGALHLFRSPAQLRGFNIAMAVLLVLSVLPELWPA
jgi:threonine/homoserine/homoserine lactone efflux protein